MYGKKFVLLGAIGALGMAHGAAAQGMPGSTAGPYIGAALGVNLREDAALRLRGDALDLFRLLHQSKAVLHLALLARRL